MDWVIYALLVPIILAGSNVLDQILVRHKFGLNGINMVLRTGVMYILPSAVLLAYSYQEALDVRPLHIVALLTMGGIWIAALFPYFRALQISNASTVAAIFNTIPVFTFLLAWLLYGEIITFKQFIAAAIILASAFLLTVDLEKLKPDLNVLLLAGTSALAISFCVVGLRGLSLYYEPAVIVGYMMLGSSLAIILYLLARADVRRNFISDCRDAPKIIFVIFLIQFSLDTIAHVFTVMGLKAGPSAGLVNTIWSLQPIFAYFYLIIGGFFLKQWFEKANCKKEFTWNIVCFVFMVSGISLLHTP